jgi:hypothetical protein
MLRNALALTGILVLILGCGPRGGEQPPAGPSATTDVATEESADSAFDRALDDMTRAFFYHHPELATTYGVSELVVPRTAHRLMSRSPMGETGRREELGAALERMQAIDPAGLTGDRPRTHAVVTTLLDGALAPARVAGYGTTIDGFGFWYLPYPINQISGPTVDIPNFLNSKQPVTSYGLPPCRTRWTGRWKAFAMGFPKAQCRRISWSTNRWPWSSHLLRHRQKRTPSSRPSWGVSRHPVLTVRMASPAAR